MSAGLRTVWGAVLVASFPLMLALAFQLRFDTPIWAAVATTYRNGGL